MRCHSASSPNFCNWLVNIWRGCPATEQAAASATASAAVYARLSAWVMRVLAKTNLRRRSLSSQKRAPMMALRIAGPLPAEFTPLCSGENPIQSRRHALAVANPAPAGNAIIHQRSFHASRRRKTATSSPASIKACAVISACSVSSLIMPYPSTNLCRSPSGHRRAIRSFVIPSDGKPIASPTAPPTSKPTIRC